MCQTIVHVAVFNRFRMLRLARMAASTGCTAVTRYAGQSQLQSPNGVAAEVNIVDLENATIVRT